MSTNQNKETTRKLYEHCLNKRNYELLKEIISDEYTGANGEKGPAGFEQGIKPLILAFPDIQWKVDDLVQEGDKVVIQHSWTGTHTGVFRGISASNKAVHDTGVGIFQFNDNKIISAWVQTDRLGFLQQIGVIPTDVTPAPPKNNFN